MELYKHPEIVSGLRTRSMGVGLPERRRATAATIIPFVGCPMGCNFCTTSSFFGGKGKFHNLNETGDELFELMEAFENSMKVQTFCVMDENFLLHRVRAIQSLERMKAAGKSWGLAVFASANAIRKYAMKELVELGVSWIWMGLESVNSKYAKLEGKDTHELTHELREHGIHHDWPGAPNPGQHCRRNRARHQPRNRFPPVHAWTPLFPALLYIPIPENGNASNRKS
jgi:pyruvate-formate lyase-activating enzyme